MTASKFYDWRQRYGRVNEIRRSRRYFVATELPWPLFAAIEVHFPVDHVGHVTTAIEKLHNFLPGACQFCPTRACIWVLLVVVGFAGSQEKMAGKTATKKTELSDPQYTKQALSSAPSAIAKDAGVVRTDKDGKMNTLRESKNGFTCMIALATPMCADANSMAFFDAWMKHENPPDKLGITYMLGGDKGASNTDPSATAKTADNHWVVTGPHIMIVGPGSKSLGLSESADADPSKPYMMWAGTPYEHAMIPVASPKPAASAASMKASTKEGKK